MKQSKIFHYLYLSVMVAPFVAVIFNVFTCFASGTQMTTETIVSTLCAFPVFGGLSATIQNIYNNVIVDMFGMSGSVAVFVSNAMTYWTAMSLIWLMFDVVIFVPFMIHNLIDKCWGAVNGKK